MKDPSIGLGPPPDAGAAIATRGLTKVFGSGPGAVRAVEDLDLEVRRGEVFGLLGPNGAGKTTTIRMLCGLLSPTAGAAFVDGRPVADDPGRARSKIGLVPGEGGHMDLLTASEELEYYGSFFGLDARAVRSRSAPLLERLGLAGRESDRVGSYSKGMRRKLHLVRALLHEPAVLVLDEPTSGLDPAVVEEVWDILMSLSRDHSVTILLSSHQLDEVERLCDRVAVIMGRLLAHGTISELAGGSSFEIELDGEAAGFADALKSAPGVTAVCVEGPRLKFGPAAGSSKSPVPEAVKALAAAGAGVLRAGPFQADLRALYRSIVGEGGGR